jgi:hypothetical protein
VAGGVGTIGDDGEDEVAGGSLIFSTDLDCFNIGSEGERLIVEGTDGREVDVDEERRIDVADELDIAGETPLVGVADPIFRARDGNGIIGL